MKFKTILLQAGKTATGIQVPAEIVDGFNAGKKPPIRVTINGYTYRNTIAVMGGVYMVGVSAEHRAGAGIEGGQQIEVDIQLDADPRIVDIPAEFQIVLDKNPAAKKQFETLSNSKKKALVIPIKDAKTSETRERRIEKAIELLKAGK